MLFILSVYYIHACILPLVDMMAEMMMMMEMRDLSLLLLLIREEALLLCILEVDTTY